MSSDDNLNLVYGVGALILVASSLAVRRMPVRQTLKMAAGWIGIFAALYAVFLFLPELKSVWSRAKADVSGNPELVTGGVIRLRKEQDGHFYTFATVNGVNLRFLVDSGATITTLSRNDALHAKVEIDEDGFPVAVVTANGSVMDRRGLVRDFRVGSIRKSDFSVHVSDGLTGTNIIGMNFLSSLNSWQVVGDEMMLKP
jgi:aspartyl protease family protein